MTISPCPAMRGTRDHTIQMVMYLNAHLDGKTVQRQYVDTKRWRDVGVNEIAGAQQYDNFRIKPLLTASEVAAEAYWAEREKLACDIYGVVEQVRGGCAKSGCKFSVDASRNPKTDCECLDLPGVLRVLADRVREMNMRIDTVVLPRNGTYPDTTEATS